MFSIIYLQESYCTKGIPQKDLNDSFSFCYDMYIIVNRPKNGYKTVGKQSNFY